MGGKILVLKSLLFGWVLVLPMAIFATDSTVKPYSAPKGQLQIPPPSKEPAPQPVRQLPQRPLLPPMAKPFGMPGVVAYQNGKWEGSDFLTFLSNDIAVNVEIVRGENVPQNLDLSGIESKLADSFRKENINPTAEVVEGPPLPFFQVLVFIYPISADKFVILANGRLFEQVQVMRKNFAQAGYWQAITWEIQDTVTSSAQQLDFQVKMLVEKTGTAFAVRYRQYNAAKDPGALPVR